MACGLQHLFECVLDTKGEAYWPRRDYTSMSEAYNFGDTGALLLAWERNELVQKEWPQNRFSKDVFISRQIETNWSSVLPGGTGGGGRVIFIDDSPETHRLREDVTVVRLPTEGRGIMSAIGREVLRTAGGAP